MLVNPYLGNKIPIIKESSFLSLKLFLTGQEKVGEFGMKNK